MRWNSPKEAAILMAKIVVALIGAMIVTSIITLLLPIGNFNPRTPGGVVSAVLLQITWGLFIFKLVFGEFLPGESLKSNGS